MFKDELYLNLSEHVYSDTFMIVEDYNQIIVSGMTNENGYYKQGNFACASYKNENENKIIIAFRGTDSFGDILGPDFAILAESVPKRDFQYAEKFYLKLKELYPGVQIEFTGHSLGGAIAQLMGAKYGHKTVTFNAPGMLNCLDDIGCASSLKYNNIINYSVLNDYVGNFRAHVGDTYYIPPIPISDKPLYDTHNGIFSFTEATHGEVFSKLPDFTTNHALALWYYDINNPLHSVNYPELETYLQQAVTLVERHLGNYGKLVNSLSFFSLSKGYLIGANTGCELTGRNTDDKIWGNQGNDILFGNGGNDELYGGIGDDILVGGTGNDYFNGGSGYDTYKFFTGDGKDVLDEVEQSIVSVKGITYKTKQGQLIVNNQKLTGGNRDYATGALESNEEGVTYEWNGYNDSNLVIKYGINDQITIRHFKNGDLDIYFDTSIVKDKSSIKDYLKKDKQGVLDLLNRDDKTVKVPHLQYEDTSTGKLYDVINCETTDKIIKAYGKNFANGILDEAGNYILVEAGQKLSLTQTPLDYSKLVEDYRGVINGEEIEQTDLAIQNPINLPKSSAEGSPTLQDVYYQYTTKPSGGGLFLSGLFTLVQIAACVVTQQYWGAAMVALKTGIAGDKVSKISSIIDLVGSVGSSVAGSNNLKGILSGVFKGSGSITGGASNIIVPEADSILKGSVSKSNWWDSLRENENLKALANFRFTNLLVNASPEVVSGNTSYYNINTYTGSVSAPYEVYISNVDNPDISTPTTPVNPLTGKIDRGCPLVLDLDNDGVETLNIDETDIYFNTQNSNFSTKVGWIKKDDALLAVDLNNDGKITSQAELFGTETQSGFAILKNYDSNNDGIINASDTNFSKLRIWQDLNENGITDEGELKTLAQAGISSISLDALKINEEQNSNTITSMSTFTKTDGSVMHIYNVNLAYNKIYTKYNGEYNLSADVLDMPWLRGFGQVGDLQLVMSENEDLKQFVKTLTKIDDAKNLYDKMDEFIAKWMGCEDIAFDAKENNISLREIYVLNKYLGTDIPNGIAEDKKVFIDSAYLSLKNKIYTNFLAQTTIGNAFEINYDYKTDSLLYNDNTYENLIANLPNQKNFYASYIIAKVLNEAECLDGNKLAYTISEKGYGASLISYLNSGLQILESGEFEILNPNTPMYVIGTSGNDTIIGTDNADIIYGMDGDDIINGGAGDDYLSGGAGNDLLIGGDGNDTLDGGEGDDELQGGYGDDIYIYDGNGKDTIIDERWVKIARQEWYQSGYWIFKKWKSRWVYQDKLVDAGNDTIIFGENVKEKDISINRIGNDLILSLKNSDDKLTIKNWYSSTEQRVEKFVFADGLIINSDQIINMITDTPSDDNLIANDNPNFIVSSTGDDTIYSKKGDDVIVNFEGNTTYLFNKGDGNDVIMDYAGQDKIQFGSGIATNDVKFVRNNKDLIISVNDMNDSLTILNWFENDLYKIEEIKFADGTLISSSDILDLISVNVATGYDDVIIGNDEDNYLDGLSGNDYIEGRGGNDTIIGGLGKDIMVGGLGDDKYYVDNAGDKVVENVGEGTDTIYSSVTYSLPDNVENITLIGSGNINAEGNNLNNIITGNDGNNILNGVAGINTLRGGKGDDTYIINSKTEIDTIEENVNEGIDSVVSSISYMLPDNVENLILNGEDNINGFGNVLDNYIEGNSGDNFLFGLEGNDILYGNGGNDTLIGGVGDDIYIVDKDTVTIQESVNEGNDTVISSISYTLGSNLENLTLTGNEDLSATGNELDNIITGNDGNNIISGSKGNDILKGGKGSDTYLFNIGDGDDTIIEDDISNEALDVIKFGEGITKDNLILNKSGYDLIITFNNSSDKITVKNSNLNYGARIERFEFSDGSFIDAKQLYVRNSERNLNNLYSDVNYLNINSKSSAIDREYDDDGNLVMERIYNENGYVSKETYYYAKLKRPQTVKNYNDIGQIIDETNYDNFNEITDKKEYVYNSYGQLSEEKAYIGSTAIDTTTRYSYNDKGLLVQSVVYKRATTSVKSTVNYTYDSQERLIDKEIYNSVGNLEEKISYTYNNAGFLTNKHTLGGYNKFIGVNTDGTKKTEWTMKTNEDITYTYNADNQLLKEIFIEDCYEVITETRYGKEYTYNKYDTRVAKEVNYTYDSNGNLKNKNTTVGYHREVPQFNEVIYKWDYRPSEEILYEYDNQGRLLKETVNGDYVTYEESTRVTYKVWHMRKNAETTYTYNDMGNIINIKRIRGYNKGVPTVDKLDSEWAYITEEEHTYTYNENGQVVCDSLIEDYVKTISKKVGTKTYTYPEWFSAKTTETHYVYDKYCRVIEVNTYKTDSYDNWSPYLYETVHHTYDDGGRIILTEYSRNNKLIEVLKYDYTFDDNNLLIKQRISKAIISNNSISGYKIIDEIEMNSYYNNLNGNSESDTITGGDQNDNINGNAGNDFLYGNKGNDILNGGEGADLMVGGIGDDTYFVDNIYDKIVEYENEGIDTVKSTLNYTLSKNLENLVLLTETNLNGTGNSADNQLCGNNGNNILSGLGGNDVLIGNKGNDTLYGGEGSDTYVFADGDGNDLIYDISGNNDTIIFDSSVNRDNIAFFKDGNDLIIDYGSNSGQSIITISNQYSSENVIERIRLSDGHYISNEDVNKIIQNMISYAANNDIEFTGIESVKNNDDLMNLIASSWH